MFLYFNISIHLFIDGDKSRCFTDDDESIKDNTIAIVTGQIKGGEILKSIFILFHLQKKMNQIPIPQLSKECLQFAAV